MATLFDHAASLHQKGYLEEAEELYGKILRENPKHAATYCNLGLIKKTKGLDEDAILMLQKALSLNANLPSAAKALANLYFARSNWLEAAKCYQNYLRFDFNNFVLLNLGQCLEKLGLHDDASTCFLKALEIKEEIQAYFFWTDFILSNNKSELFPKAISIGKSIVSKQVEDSADVLYSNGAKLSFDLVNRRVKHLEITEQRHYPEKTKTEQVDTDIINKVYPQPFLGELQNIDKSTELLSKGFKIKNNLISPECCSQILRLLDKKKQAVTLNEELLSMIYHRGILNAALEAINTETRTKNIAWNFLGIRNFSSQDKPDKESLAADERAIKSEHWHIDHGYNQWSQKCLIFLQPEPEGESSADFCDVNYTNRFTELTGYKGWGIDKKYRDHVQGHTTTLDLDPVTLEPPFIEFKADHPGQSLLYCPARILHRVPISYAMDRIYLSFSFTPLPPSCEYSDQYCINKTMEVLRKKSRLNLANVDDMPVWI